MGTGSMLAFSQSSRWLQCDIFGSSVLLTFLLESLRGTSPISPPTPQLILHESPANLFKALLTTGPTAWELTQIQLLRICCDWPLFPFHSLPPYTAGTQTSLKFITFHYTPRRAWIRHCAFHGGKRRKNVKSFTGERSVATATGPDGHGCWDLLVPLSWKTEPIMCYDQGHTVMQVHHRGVFCPHSNTPFEFLVKHLRISRSELSHL